MNHFNNLSASISVVVMLFFLGCAQRATLNTYKPKDVQIVYRQGSENSAKITRDDYAKLSNEFNFTQNSRQNDNAFALIIGINQYKEQTNVEHADYSALAFEELAQKTLGVPKENILTLINSDASSGQLKSKLELIRELPDAGGTIYFFFAGHGVPGKDGKTYLLPSDMSADAIHLEPNLQLDTIYKRLSQSLASNIYVFMDTCFSGKDAKGDLLYKGVAPVLRSKKAKVASKKITVLTAGSGTDFANDYSEKNHRLFSYFLIDQLSKGESDLNKVYESIRKKVKRISLQKGIGYKQIPQIYGNLSRRLY